MHSVPTVTVTSIRRPRYHARRYKRKMNSTVEVTRIQPSSLKARNVTKESAHVSPTMSNIPLMESEGKPLTSTIASSQRLAKSSTSKVNREQMNHEGQMSDGSHLASVSPGTKSVSNGIDLRSIQTIGRINKKKQYCPFPSNWSIVRVILFILLVLALLAVAIVVPVVLLTSTRATTVTTTTASTTSSTASTAAATVTITSNICTSTWSGITMIASCTNCSYILSYYNFLYNYTAIATTTRIAFGLQRQTGFFALDDISVRDFLSPTIEILVNGGFEMGNLASWLYCNQNNASISGGVKSNSSNFSYLGFNYSSNSGSYYFVGGNNISTEYITQTFPTTVGDRYLVSFYVLVASAGPETAGAFFLGV